MTLTWALVTLGALVLVALLCQGWWNTRKAGPRRAERGDTVPDGLRQEPALGSAELAHSVAAAPGLTSELRATRREVRIDALIDVIATLQLDAPITGDLALAHLPASRRAGSKAFIVEGLDVADGQWGMPLPGHRYSELQAGVQLANRSGALNEIEYSEFVQKVQAFADSVGAVPDFPDMLEAVARARELDGLIGPLDAQLTVTLRSNSVAWSVGYIQQCAARHGFVPGAVPGRLVLPAAEDAAPPMLVLAFDAQAALAEDPQSAPVRECALSLDVPQTEERAEPFPAWHNAARSLADDMDALLVDDKGQAVTLHAFAMIGEELSKLYRQLETLDLAAGTPAARRIFS